MPTITAIETRWNGYRFRSRLEARWAVFFSRLGMRFEYETEGFELPDGRYLPDFYLPDVSWWAEVKPAWFTTAEENKVYSFVKHCEQRVLLLDGPPRFVSFFGMAPARVNPTEVESIDYSLDIHTHMEAFFKDHRLWGQPSFGTENTKRPGIVPLFSKPAGKTSDCDNQESARQYFSKQYQDAVDAALSERFERPEVAGRTYGA